MYTHIKLSQLLATLVSISVQPIFPILLSRSSLRQVSL